MYTKTIKTPLIVQLTFLAFVLVMMSPFIIYVANANPLVTQCQNSFIWYEYNPKLEKKCRPLWTLWTNEIKKSFNTNK